MNLSTSGLLFSAKQDVVARQLATTASAKGVTYDPTSKAKISNHETDKQSEDNATWFFEYKALLNSKLTTLTTALTSAYTTDLDASMGAQSNSKVSYPWLTKNAMQGLTGQKDIDGSTMVDPGAARTAYAYFNTFGYTTISSSPTTTAGTGAPGWSGDDTDASPLGTTASIVSANSGGIVSGTSTFTTGGTSQFLLDNLQIDFSDTTKNKYTKDGSALSGRIAGNVITTSPGVTTSGNVGNNVEMTLYKFFAKPENFDILRFGLFQDVFVVGTSSLPTGSQVQGSIKLNYEVPASSSDPLQNKAIIRITQERYAAFFHS
jgi:hypothetical protein